MQLWLSKSSDVALREQLTAQIVLGIISGDLKANQKLPSTRELARRFEIHANTVSAAYQDLLERGWVEFRKGSGVYVRKLDEDAKLDAKLELDQMIAVFIRVARDKGYALGEIQARVKYWMGFQPPDHFLVIESDPHLQKILIAEIEEAIGFPATGAQPDQCANPTLLAGAAPVALYSQAEAVRAALPSDTNCLLLNLRSVPLSLEHEQRPATDALIAVVSHWPDFLKWGRAILVAAGVEADALSFRHTDEPGWQKGLSSCATVITESLTARRLPKGCKTRIFRIIADSSLNELRKLKTFFTKPT